AAAAPTPTASADRAAVNLEIRSIATVAGLDQGWIDSQIDANATTEAARAAAFDAMRARSAPTGQIRTTTAPTLDDPAVRAAAMGEALLCRIDPAHQPSAPARAFVGLSLPEMARDCLRNAGLPVTGLGASAVVTRALHSTSDFALALSDTQGRVLTASYKAAASGLKPLAREVSLPDFRARTFIRTSGISDLEKVNESGEFKRGSFDHAGESVTLATYGKVFGISRQALVNDDIGALADIPAKLGAAAARFEADQLGTLLVSNAGAGPTMADAVALFHTMHDNFASGSGEAPDEATLSEARLAMRAQTDDAGFLISVVPKYLVVGPALETAAEKLLAAIQPTQVSDVQPIRLTLVVEPRLAGNAWYVVDPTVDGLVYAHLAGEGGPQIESRAGFDVDGVETRVRLDFGCAFIDWRGWYRNAGAA
ncbi:Mu-like prophage major head subunit gpT family protein, partial [Xanthobacter autotrophicus]|uniref:phage major capsid protein n=2 Tax=Xanthobacter TaxID=279 RepID=UPI0032C1CB25